MGLREELARVLRDLPPGVHKVTPPSARRALRHRLGRYYAWEVGFDFHDTPALQAGEVDGPPDFVGIGVQKAGTTWWFRLLVKHPEVTHLLTTPRDRHFFGPIQKERHFFARFGYEEFADSDVEEYSRWFPRRKGTMTGEWTPDYLYYPWVPPLLARAAPDARLLVILRDPIQRFRSGYAGALRYGADHVGAAVGEAVGHSLYADNISRWLDHFPSEQLLVLQYEKCVAEPAKQLADTYRFVGLDPDFVPADIASPVNKTVEKKTSLADEVMGRLHDIFDPDIVKLANLVPSLDLSLWTEIADA
jgi:hypothetical protein